MSLLSKVFGKKETGCSCGIDLDEEINKAKSNDCCDSKEKKDTAKSSCCSFDLDAEIEKAKEL